MVNMRQRRGDPMAVGHVENEEDHKEHEHVSRVVRQGPFFGTLYFLGQLVPLLALRYCFFPSERPAVWRCTPMAFRSFAGLLSQLAYGGLRRYEWAAGRERWFASFFITIANMFTLFITLAAELQLGADWSKCPQPLAVVLATVGCGVLFAMLDRLWPKLVYRLELIESHDPPTPYRGEGTESMNPYEGLYSTKERMFGHALVFVRSVNIAFLVPIVENLFFREFLFELFQTDLAAAGPAVHILLPALLWACYGTHYKGDVVIRFAFGIVLQLLATSGTSTCLWLPPVAAHGIRNLLGVAGAVATRKWHYWRV